KRDVEVLQQAVLDGTIDCIATHHLPHEYDSKVLEFEYAKYGMTGLETAYAAIKTVLPNLPESRWVELVSINPRKIFGLPHPAIQKNAPASITLFEPGTPVTLSAFHSKSKNSAFMGKTLQGMVKGIINKETLFLN